MPKSKEYTSSPKTDELLEILSDSDNGTVTYHELLKKFKVPDIHYNCDCPSSCQEKDSCNMARKALKISRFIVKALNSRDCFSNLVDSPFVVGSTKEQTKVFSLGRYLSSYLTKNYLICIPLQFYR